MSTLAPSARVAERDTLRAGASGALRFCQACYGESAAGATAVVALTRM